MKLHRVIFNFFVFFLPTQLTYFFWPNFSLVYGIRVDYLAPVLYFTDFLLLFLIIAWLIEEKPKFLTIKHSTKIVFLILILAILNIIFSQLPFLSLYKWLRVVELILLFEYVQAERGALENLKTPLALTLMLTLVIAVCQLYLGHSIGGFLYWIGERQFSSSTSGIALFTFNGSQYLRPYATFSHPNVLGGFSLVSFFLLIHSRKLINKIGAIAAVLLIIISFSQNAWIALFLVPFVCLVLRKRVANFSFFVFIIVIFSLLLPVFSKSIINLNLGREVTERAELYMGSGKIMSAHPLLGAGLGVFPSLVPAHTLLEAPYRWLQPVHNIFLLATAEMGLMGLMAFATLVIKNFRKINAEPLTGILLTGLFDHYWLTQMQAVFLFIIILALTSSKNNLLE